MSTKGKTNRKIFQIATTLVVLFIIYMSINAYFIFKKKKILSEKAKLTYSLVVANLTFTHFGRNNFIRYKVPFKDSSIEVEEKIFGTFFFKRNFAKLGDSVLIAKFHDNTYNIIIRKSWIKECNLKVPDSLMRYVYYE